MPSHNVEGLPESKLKARWRADQGYSAKVKKRLLKDLSPDSRMEIVRLYEEEHMLQKDIAERYRVSTMLISTLIKDAEK